MSSDLHHLSLNGVSFAEFLRTNAIENHEDYVLFKSRFEELNAIPHYNMSYEEEIEEKFLDALLYEYEADTVSAFVRDNPSRTGFLDLYNAQVQAKKYEIYLGKKAELKRKQREARLNKLIYIPTEEEVMFPSTGEAEDILRGRLLFRYRRNIFNAYDKNARVLQNYLSYFMERKRRAREEMEEMKKFFGNLAYQSILNSSGGVEDYNDPGVEIVEVEEEISQPKKKVKLPLDEGDY